MAASGIALRGMSLRTTTSYGVEPAAVVGQARRRTDRHVEAGAVSAPDEVAGARRGAFDVEHLRPRVGPGVRRGCCSPQADRRERRLPPRARSAPGASTMRSMRRPASCPSTTAAPTVRRASDRCRPIAASTSAVAVALAADGDRHRQRRAGRQCGSGGRRVDPGVADRARRERLDRDGNALSAARWVTAAPDVARGGMAVAEQHDARNVVRAPARRAPRRAPLRDRVPRRSAVIGCRRIQCATCAQRRRALDAAGRSLPKVTMRECGGCSAALISSISPPPPRWHGSRRCARRRPRRRSTGATSALETTGRASRDASAASSSERSAACVEPCRGLKFVRATRCASQTSGTRAGATGRGRQVSRHRSHR